MLGERFPSTLLSETCIPVSTAFPKLLKAKSEVKELVAATERPLSYSVAVPATTLQTPFAALEDPLHTSP